MIMHTPNPTYPIFKLQEIRNVSNVPFTWEHVIEYP